MDFNWQSHVMENLINIEGNLRLSKYMKCTPTMKILLNFLSEKLQLWQIKQGDREPTEYYMEMVALLQQIDLCSEEEWQCFNDSVSRTVFVTRKKGKKEECLSSWLG